MTYRNALPIALSLLLMAGCTSEESQPPVSHNNGWLDDAGADTASPDVGADTGPAAVAAVRITPQDPVLEIYEIQELTATALDAEGNELATHNVEWTSSAPDVAEVNQYGTVIANEVGRATVTGTVDGVSGAVRVTVQGKPVGTVEITPANRSIEVGEQLQMTIFLDATDGSPIPDGEREVAWASSDDSVATVSNAGLITGLSPGETTITATSEGVSDTASITVAQPPEAGVDRVEVSPSSAQLVRGDTVELQAQVFDTDDNPMPDAAVTWTSSAPDVAGVDAGGRVDAVAEGVATIVTSSGGKTATARIEVSFSLETIGAGTDFACGLILGVAHCWGVNGDGQLGRGNTSSREGVGRVADSLRFDSLALGSAHACGITRSGDTYCWGDNAKGQLGDGTTTDRSAPTLVSGSHRFVELSGGRDHTCGIDTGGQIWCWGANADGQLGDATNNDAAQPVRLADTFDATALTAGAYHSCAVAAAGETYCWGRNDDGQLGDNSTASQTSPTLVTGGYTFTAVHAGGKHTCGLASGGTVACWGDNDNGQIGDGGSTDRLTPILVPAQAQFSRVSVGFQHTCALAPGGDIYCWGVNDNGQLGIGSTTLKRQPTQAASTSVFTDVAVAGESSCALDDAGKPYCWGFIASDARTPQAVAGF